MNDIILTKRQARQFILLKQGLLDDYRFYRKEGVYEYIKKAGCIQFDPIDVCGKNPELVLQSRVKDFSKDMLYELLYEDRKLIDYFDKNMSIFPIENWHYFSRQRNKYGQNIRSEKEVHNAIEKVKSVIEEKGFISSKDINFKKQVDWFWSSATLTRAVLETLYFRGELIVHHKKGSIKHYAFAEKHISSEILNKEDPNKTKEDYLKWAILRRIGAIGLLWNKASDAFLGILELKSDSRNASFKQLFHKNKVGKIRVEGINQEFYYLSQDRSLLEKVLKKNDFIERTEFIAPLDNMLWDRNLINSIFDFEYRWEIYTPIEKRKYGYYVLPVLSGDKFIGRIEMVNDRKTESLIVKNFWPEGHLNANAYNEILKESIEKFAVFNNCKNIVDYRNN